MEYVAAAAFIVLAGGCLYALRRRSKASKPQPPAFVCPHCGERHCQCERQT
jgi:hypothetical protein